MQVEVSLILTHLQPYFNVIICNFTPYLNPRLQNDLFHALFRIKICLNFLYLPCLPDIHPISTDFTLLPQHHIIKCKNYEVLRHAFFSNILETARLGSKYSEQFILKNPKNLFAYMIYHIFTHTNKSYKNFYIF